MKISLAGEYKVSLDNGFESTAILPSTLDENHIGEKEKEAEAWHPDSKIDENLKTAKITTRLTRNYRYDGIATFTKNVSLPNLSGKRAFIKVERARQLSLYVNGKKAKEHKRGTLSTPYIFEVTDLVLEENEIKFVSSNLYEGWPKESIRVSSCATNETQTNWNGLLGEIVLEIKENNFIDDIKVYPSDGFIDIKLIVNSKDSFTDNLVFTSSAFESFQKECKCNEGKNELWFKNIKTIKNVKKWDEYEGNLHSLSVKGEKLLNKEIRFGLRVFGDDGDGHLAINGRRIFLRSETNCCAFAQSGHMPILKEDWIKVLSIYKEYGVNMVRFHSHCPPEGAFLAADELGMIIQPELSCWNPKNAMEDDEEFKYYKMELEEILDSYANHPSFCMITFGNELKYNEKGLRNLHKLLEIGKNIDKTRLFAIASNQFYGEKGPDEKSDFYTSSNYGKDMIRGTNAGMWGHINNTYPNAKTSYNQALDKMRDKYKKPVFSFEVGQYEVLPDFSEISKFNDLFTPDNFIAVYDKVKKKGKLSKWDRWVSITGEMSRLAYREEIEACLRTPHLSGISLLGLQDFPGQGTAIVGMINSHFETKPFPFARPSRFKEFFKSAIPLAYLDKYTYTKNEKMEFKVYFANYSKEDILGELICILEIEGEEFSKANLKRVTCYKNGLNFIGKCTFDFKNIEKNTALNLKIKVREHKNNYPIWVYVDTSFDVPKNIKICEDYKDALSLLEKGETVLLMPKAKKEVYKNAIKTHFTTDFWSVGTFPFQQGYMGCDIDKSHPLFKNFPTDEYTSWQWWSLTNSVAIVLPDNIEPIFDVLDCYARLRNLAFMVEANVSSGKLLLCTMGLFEKQHYPEARAMLKSIYDYMSSDEFNPKISLSKEDIKNLFN